MHWLVVRFTKEDAVEAVPETWYITESKECFWPPKTYKLEKIIKTIEHGDSPLTDWEVYPAVILGRFDNFVTAQRKAKKALLTTDLSSNTDSYYSRAPRKRKRNPRYESSESDTDSRKSLGISSEDDTNSYPCFNKEIPESLNRPTKKKAHDNIQKNSIRTTPDVLVGGTSTSLMSPHFHENVNVWDTPRALVSTSFALSRDENVLVTPRIEGQIRKHVVPADEDFKRVVMDELSQINLKLDSLLDKVGTLINSSRVQKSADITNFDVKVKELYEKIPVETENQLTELEVWLNEENNYRIMISELERIGGRSMGQCIRKILYRIMLDEVALLFSWDGAKQKKAFKHLKLSKAILDAVKVQYNSAKDTEIIETIKYWLVKAKERISHKLRRVSNN
uniref:Uncharacterized protein LOC114343030 n=1 Tax=Diabrotica virgifera virgifera TaxID=50390 RepID=A0A6P7H0S6_DIAVI